MRSGCIAILPALRRTSSMCSACNSRNKSQSNFRRASICATSGCPGTRRQTKSFRRATVRQSCNYLNVSDIIKNIISIAYEHPDTAQTSCSTAHAWAKKPREPAAGEKVALIARAKQLLKERDAVLVAHYYVHPDLQDLAKDRRHRLRLARDGALRPRASGARRSSSRAFASWARRRRSSTPRSAC